MEYAVHALPRLSPLFSCPLSCPYPPFPCPALTYLHSKHIAHCDMSLENVLVRQSTMDICIIDYGLAVATDGLGHSEELMRRPACGKMNYLAPEVRCLAAPLPPALATPTPHSCQAATPDVATLWPCPPSRDHVLCFHPPPPVVAFTCTLHLSLACVCILLMGSCFLFIAAGVHPSAPQRLLPGLLVVRHHAMDDEHARFV